MRVRPIPDVHAEGVGPPESAAVRPGFHEHCDRVIDVVLVARDVLPDSLLVLVVGTGGARDAREIHGELPRLLRDLTVVEPAVGFPDRQEKPGHNDKQQKQAREGVEDERPGDGQSDPIGIKHRMRSGQQDADGLADRQVHAAPRAHSEREDQLEDRGRDQEASH